MPRHFISPRALSVAVVLAGVLAGCTTSEHDELVLPSSTPRAGAAPSPSLSATTTATPFALASPSPPSALSAPPSAEAAVLAGQYFLDLFHYAYMTGDESGVRSFGDPNCSYCNTVADQVVAERTAGKHESGGEISVTKASGTRVDAEFYTANFTIEQADSQVLDSKGARVDGSAGGTFKVDVALYYRSGHWSVAAVEAHRS